MTPHTAALLRLALALGAELTGGPLSAAERELADQARHLAPEPDDALTRSTVDAILSGKDPFGDLFYSLRDAGERRSAGAVYTPAAIVEPMTAWVLGKKPARVVDAGCGSGRFAVAVASAAPDIELVAIDLDPVATIMTRAVLHTITATRVQVIHGDYTKLTLNAIDGSTAFLGNPPYLRHHQIPAESKAWAQATAMRLGHKVSGLAGLHAYFYLATAQIGRKGDIGCFVTSAEWLDVNYGSIIRNLLIKDLGGLEVHVIEPTATPFEGTATTAAIVQFSIGAANESIGFRAVPTLDELAPLTPNPAPVARERLVEAPRWSVFTKTRTHIPAGFIELGELARVHRGTVTGANATWVAREAVDLPDSMLYRSITKARELFAAGATLSTADHLRHVIDIPADLDTLDDSERRRVDRFLRRARKDDVHEGYVARNRRAWWAVGLKQPAPILATYMARRPPAFVLNSVGARHINIAHGLYPREELSAAQLSALAACLSQSVVLGQGRTYAGGLTKFEPREMERLPIPDLATLSNDASSQRALVEPLTPR